MKKFNYKNLNFKKMNGLIPAIIQDNETLQVLMLGFMNEKALKRTLKDRKVSFWSRTRDCLWQKGEISGSFLKLVFVETDCDNDSLLIMVEPEGPVCHKGAYSCFGGSCRRSSDLMFLNQLYKLIKDRKKNLPENSYTASLFREGIDKITEKVEEEAGEVVVAAKNESKRRLIEESADLLYHFLVLLLEKNISLQDVIAELVKRDTGH